MAKRKSKPKQLNADLAALGDRIANAVTTAHDRLAYWWNELHPNRQPVTVDIQIVDATVLPINSRDVPPTPDELRQYFVARLGYSLPDYELMNLGEVVDVLKREAELQTRATPDLSETQQRIVDAVGSETLKGQVIANRVDLDYEYIRKLLPPLVQLNALEKASGGGYRRPRM